VWSVIGALSEATTLPVATAVTCPTVRLHPAVIVQASATAAVSTWLNAGVPPTQVAESAGHSVAVLLQIYAKCLAGQEEIARQRIAVALGSPGTDGRAT
jgi:hypothetical protein